MRAQQGVDGRPETRQMSDYLWTRRGRTLLSAAPRRVRRRPGGFCMRRLISPGRGPPSQQDPHAQSCACMLQQHRVFLLPRVDALLCRAARRGRRGRDRDANENVSQGRRRRRATSCTRARRRERARDARARTHTTHAHRPTRTTSQEKAESPSLEVPISLEACMPSHAWETHRDTWRDGVICTR